MRYSRQLVMQLYRTLQDDDFEDEEEDDEEDEDEQASSKRGSAASKSGKSKSKSKGPSQKDLEKMMIASFSDSDEERPKKPAAPSKGGKKGMAVCAFIHSLAHRL